MRRLGIGAVSVAALAATALLASPGCRTAATASGYLSIREPRYFEIDTGFSDSLSPSRNSYAVRLEFEPCNPNRGSSRDDRSLWGPESESARLARERREREYRGLCARSYRYVIDLPSFYSVSGLAVDVRCGGMEGHPDHVICTGWSLDEVNRGLGPIAFVVVTRGRDVLGFHIWQSLPAPELIATFGDLAAGLAPGEIRFSRPAAGR